MSHIQLTGTAKNPTGSPARESIVISVGFGIAICTRDGETIFDDCWWERLWESVHSYSVEPNVEVTAIVPVWDSKLIPFNSRTVQDMEVIASLNPNHDWRIVLEAPLWSAIWQRQERGWICVEAGQGFA